jgi:hypothetical protein
MNFFSAIAVGFLGAGSSYMTTVYTKELTCRTIIKKKPCFRREHPGLGAGIFKYVFTMELVITAVQLSLFFVLLFTSHRLYFRMLKFHDQITGFKLTPRSKIFRRYLPPLDSIEEAAQSRDERSSVKFTGNGKNSFRTP